MADSDDDSADLSLKLRRGSSDSRDSFYMEFDQGIDSDIEAVEAAARQREEELPPPPPLEEMMPVESPPAPTEQGGVVAAAELSDLPEEDEEEEEGVVELTVEVDTEVVVVTDPEDVVLAGEEEVLPLPEEVLPLPEEVLPLPEEVLPLPEEVLPLPEEVLPLPEEVLPLPEEVLPLPDEVLLQEERGNKDVRIIVDEAESSETEKEEEDEWVQEEQGVEEEKGVEEDHVVEEDQGVEGGEEVVVDKGVVEKGGLIEDRGLVEGVVEEEERVVDEGVGEEEIVVEEDAIGGEVVVEEDVDAEQEDVGVDVGEEMGEEKELDELRIDQVEEPESAGDEEADEEVGMEDEEKEMEEVKDVVDEEFLGVLEVEESMTEGDVSTVVDVVETLKEEEEEDEASLVVSQDFVVEMEKESPVEVLVEKEGPVQLLVEEKQREALPGPSGSALRLGMHRKPSTTSSSSSSGSASTPMRSRWDTSLQTTDTEVAAAAAAVLATGSPVSKPMLLPSPSSPSAILVSPETLSPTRTTPPGELKQMPSAPQPPSPAQPSNGPGMHRQAPTSLGSVVPHLTQMDAICIRCSPQRPSIPSTQTGIMLYSPPMAPVSLQHHPHHLQHHLHHGAPPHHQAAIKGVPEPPPPAPVELPPPPPRPPIALPPPVPVLPRIEAADNWKKRGTDALTAALSALYGKLLVVMGIAFPMAEVISTYIPPSFYEGFYLYLYIGSMFFLFYMYAMLLRDRATYSVMNSFKRARGISVSSESGGNQTDTEGSSTTERSGQHPSPCVHDKYHQEQQQHQMSTLPAQGLSEAADKKYRRPRRRRRSPPSQRTYHYGSFYLRMGAVAFGIGSMIYSGLEFGQYFELERNTKCHNVLLALTPATRMAFIFIQMYFIFLNNEMKVYKHKLLARFGLMHMIGTNLCVWLNVLVQETKHEILTFFNPENNTLGLHSHNTRQHSLAVKFAGGSTTSTSTLFGVSSGQSAHALHHEHVPVSHQVHHRVERGLKGPHHIYECRRTNIMGSLVQDASPFLFPCTIEYSLICAAILYVMWKNISRVETTRLGSSRIGKGVDCHGVATSGASGTSLVSARGKVHITPKRSPHHYSVDCARAHKGLFVGILVLVLTIISLILFFVLIGRPELVGLAVFEVNMCELTLYALSTLATIAGMIRVRELRYDGGRNLELDSILLIVSQTGMFIYSTFTVIGGHFTLERNTALVLATALASLVQTTVQTIFVLDASRRSCATASQIRRKPGREVVTFLLVANLAMWAVNTLEKSRAESHPVQLHFYGLWAWTIITHVSMPLAIFYRFHSTVCLCEIWKRAYKMKPVYM